MQIRIVPAQEGDLDTLCAIMDAAAAALDNPDLFVADDRAFIARHLGREGFTLLALAEGQAAGFLIVRLPGMAEDNLGRDLGLPPEMLGRVAHMESTAVLSPFRGHGIQKQLMARAEALLAGRGFSLCLATVHPDNAPSLHSFLRLGYRVALTKEKYQGRLRHILCKQLAPAAE